MPDKAQTAIHEVMSAMEVSEFLAMSQSSIRMLPSSSEEFANLAENLIRKVIKMSKRLNCFKQLQRHDQIALLKVSDVMCPE